MTHFTVSPGRPTTVAIPSGAPALTIAGRITVRRPRKTRYTSSRPGLTFKSAATPSAAPTTRQRSRTLAQIAIASASIT